MPTETKRRKTWRLRHIRNQGNFMTNMRCADSIRTACARFAAMQQAAHNYRLPFCDSIRISHDAKKSSGVLSVVLLSIAVGRRLLVRPKSGRIARWRPSPRAAAAAPAGGAPAGVAIEASKVAKASLPQGITAVGSLRSDESITLRPEVAGRISAIPFREGERVTKGAPLVKLDPSVTEAEAQQARANLTLAKQSTTARSICEDKASSPDRRGTRPRTTSRSARPSLALAEAKLAKLTITRAVLRDHRLALGERRRLCQGRRRHGQPRVGRSAEGRLPRARDLSARKCASARRCR